jgi:predicted alpha/beta-fold hydrolase
VGAYHVGFTKDVNQLVRMLRERFPNKKLYLSGFSLGGNVSLKFLGELGEEAEARGIYGAAVTCVPFDAAACQKKMDTNDFNRSVYAAVSFHFHCSAAGKRVCVSLLVYLRFSAEHHAQI